MTHLMIFKAPEERNYHIFYCMLAGTTAEEKEPLALGDAQEYAFLTKVPHLPSAASHPNTMQR